VAAGVEIVAISGVAVIDDSVALELVWPPLGTTALDAVSEVAMSEAAAVEAAVSEDAMSEAAAVEAAVLKTGTPEVAALGPLLRWWRWPCCRRWANSPRTPAPRWPLTRTRPAALRPKKRKHTLNAIH